MIYTRSRTSAQTQIIYSNWTLQTDVNFEILQSSKNLVVVSVIARVLSLKFGWPYMVKLLNFELGYNRYADVVLKYVVQVN